VARREVTPRVRRSAAHGRAAGRSFHFFAPVGGFVSAVAIVSAAFGPGAVVSNLTSWIAHRWPIERKTMGVVHERGRG